MKKLLNQCYIVAIYYTLLSLVCSIPFYEYVFQHSTDALLKMSVVVLLPLVNFWAAYTLLSLTRVVGKVILSLLHVLSATAFYFITVYHTMMDETMLRNVFNTQWSEASGFVTLPAVLMFLLFAVLPAVLPFLVNTLYPTWKRFGITTGSTLAAALLLILLNAKSALWIGEHDTELGGLVMPWSYTVNTCRIISQNSAANEEEILLGDAIIENDSHEAVVLVIGESARRANFSLYGYERQTNPQLEKLRDELTLIACDAEETYTTAGVRAILTPEPSAQLLEPLPNYLFRNGVDVAWWTTNWGEPPIHIDEYCKFDATDDGAMFSEIGARIRSSQNNKVLVVLHTSTSHGPKYARRYPEQFCRFTPASDDVEKTELQYLVNSYDNSILYTDHLLASAIDTLKTLEGWHTTMVYISDHGESLGEDGLFMHGVPRKIAPAVQYEIPYIIWSSEKLTNSPDDHASQYSVFNLVLNQLSISR